jgi:hypothetical protein
MTGVRVGVVVKVSRVSKGVALGVTVPGVPPPLVVVGVGVKSTPVVAVSVAKLVGVEVSLGRVPMGVNVKVEVGTTAVSVAVAVPKIGLVVGVRVGVWKVGMGVAVGLSVGVRVWVAGVLVPGVRVKVGVEVGVRVIEGTGVRKGPGDPIHSNVKTPVQSTNSPSTCPSGPIRNSTAVLSIMLSFSTDKDWVPVPLYW